MSRRFQFSLRALLVLISVVTVPITWYGYRWREFERECHAIHGTWQRIDEHGDPILFRGKPIIGDWTADNCIIDISQEPWRIDFQWPSGTAKGIYRWERGRIHVRVFSPGGGRPTGFDEDSPISYEPRATTPPILVSHSEMFFERLADRPSTSGR